MGYLKYILLFIIPINVYAVNLGFNMGCLPSTIKSGEEFVCSIYGPQDCSEAEMRLELPEGFTYKSAVMGKNYSNDGSNLTFKLTGKGKHDDLVALITITAPTVSEDTKFEIELTDIKFKYSDNLEYKTNNSITRNVKVKTRINYTTVPTTTKTSSEKLVVTLDPNGGDGESQIISCVPSVGKCEINLDDTLVPVKEGNTFKGWGSTKDCVEGHTGKYEIDSNNTLYACWESDSENKGLPYLESLNVENYAIDFSKFKYEYIINVNNDVTDLNITAIAVSETATIDINKPEKLFEGNNAVIITVKDNGSTLTYTIYVNKGQKAIDESLKLSSLKLGKYPINFNPDVNEYNVTIDYNETKLDIEGVCANSTSTYEVIGNEGLKNGSQVIITVKSAAGDEANYTINIKQKTIFEQYSSYTIAGGIIIFMLTVYFIVKIIKNNEKKEEDKAKKAPIKAEKVKKEKKTKKEKKKKKDEVETLETL